jgi:predicted RNase H-like HicB family nuclease
MRRNIASTDGRTFSELLKNLEEAIAICLEDTDTVAAFNLIPNPRVKLIMELPENYAEIA